MKAHKLIDNIKANLTDGNSSQYKFLNTILIGLKNSVKFDLGSLASVPNGSIYDLKTPYNLIYCELTEEKNNQTFGTLIEYEKVSDTYSVIVFSQNETEYYPVNLSFSVNKSFMVEAFYPTGIRENENMMNMCHEIIGVTFYLLNILNCSNVELVNNTPSKINQKRIKKDKTQLFEYKTLHIKQDTKRNIQKGNISHASPRVHLRRGHIRKLPKGNVWIQPMVVGDKTKGIIHKDYVLDPD